MAKKETTVPENVKEQEPKAPNQDAMDEVLRQIEGSNEEPVTPQVEESNEPVEKETGTQPVEESTNSEETAENEEVNEVTSPEVELTDEDVEVTLNEHKDRVQKRIDKLTAEKHSAQEEANELKERIAQLESKVNDKVSQPKSNDDDLTVTIEGQAYTEQQLRNAKSHAIKENDLELLDAANEGIMELKILKKEREFIGRQSKQSELTKQENEIWSKFVNTYKSDDKDLNFNDPGSLVIKWAKKLYQDNKNVYDTLGPYRYVQVANDAHQLILKARLGKLTNSKTKSLEKKLVDERRKTQLGSGGSNAKAEVKPKVSKDAFSDGFEPVMNNFDRLRGAPGVK